MNNKFQQITPKIQASQVRFKSILKMRHKWDYDLLHQVRHSRQLPSKPMRCHTKPTYIIQTSRPLRAKSCQCSECGTTTDHLLTKYKTSLTQQNIKLKQRGRLHLIFNRCVAQVIGINRIMSAGVEHFAQRILLKHQQRKQLSSRDKNQIQFLKKHQRIDIYQCQVSKRVEVRKPTRLNQDSLNTSRKLIKISTNLQQNSCQNSPTRFNAYTCRTRSNQSVQQYVQLRMLQLPSMPALTSRSHRCVSHKQQAQSPYAKQNKFLFRSISQCKKQ